MIKEFPGELDDRCYPKTNKMVLREIMDRHLRAASTRPEIQLQELMEEIEDKFNKLLDEKD